MNSGNSFSQHCTSNSSSRTQFRLGRTGNPPVTCPPSSKKKISVYTGCTLKQLDLDSCTLSEILRLHILASGAECNYTNAKFRYQKQGGFGSTDDPCVELRLSTPSLLKKLSCTAVYDLLPGTCSPSTAVHNFLSIPQWKGGHHWTTTDQNFSEGPFSVQQ